MLIRDEEIAALLQRWRSGEGFLEDLLREAVRLTAERCAQLCEEVEKDADENGSREGCVAAEICAKAIREATKS